MRVTLNSCPMTTPEMLCKRAYGSARPHSRGYSQITGASFPPSRSGTSKGADDMIRYLLVRYTDDLTRNEPINVGVIVYDGTHALARFDGEDPKTQAIDLRRIRHRITGSQTYRSWVAYWRRALAEPAALAPQLAGAAPGDPAVIEFLLGLGGDEFSLVPGGEILFDAEERSLEATLQELYERVVRAPDPDAPASLRDKSEHALRLAGVELDNAERFRERPTITLSVEKETRQQEVSYGV